MSPGYRRVVTVYYISIPSYFKSDFVCGTDLPLAPPHTLTPTAHLSASMSALEVQIFNIHCKTYKHKQITLH